MSSLNMIKLRITVRAALESNVLPFVSPLPAASMVYEIEILILMTKNGCGSRQIQKQDELPSNIRKYRTFKQLFFPENLRTGL